MRNGLLKAAVVCLAAGGLWLLLFLAARYVFLVRGTYRRLLEYQRVAAAFGEGRYEARASIEPSDEPGQLGPAFNDMAERVQSTDAQLRADIAARIETETKLRENERALVKAKESESYVTIPMDCHMPEIDGYSAARAIRDRERAGSRVPIIALTADPRKEARANCLAAGMDDYIAEPLRSDELAPVLGRWLAASPEPAEEHQDPSTLDPEVVGNLRELDGASPGLLGKLTSMFVEDTRSRLQRIADAIARTDAPRLAALAHEVKGSAANMGACDMASVCGALQRAAEVGDLQAAPDMFARLEAEFARAVDAISTLNEAA